MNYDLDFFEAWDELNEEKLSEGGILYTLAKLSAIKGYQYINGEVKEIEDSLDSLKDYIDWGAIVVEDNSIIRSHDSVPFICPYCNKHYEKTGILYKLQDSRHRVRETQGKETAWKIALCPNCAKINDNKKSNGYASGCNILEYNKAFDYLAREVNGKCLIDLIDNNYRVTKYGVRAYLDLNYNNSDLGKNTKSSKHLPSQMQLNDIKNWEGMDVGKLSTSSTYFLYWQCPIHKNIYKGQIELICCTYYHGCTDCLNSSPGRQGSKSEDILVNIIEELINEYKNFSINTEPKLKWFNKLDYCIKCNGLSYGIEYDGKPWHDIESESYKNQTDYRKTDSYNKENFRIIRVREKGCYPWLQTGVINNKTRENLNTQIYEIIIPKSLSLISIRPNSNIIDSLKSILMGIFKNNYQIGTTVELKSD